MKKTIFIVMAFSLLMFAGCSSTPKEVSEETDDVVIENIYDVDVDKMTSNLIPENTESKQSIESIRSQNDYTKEIYAICDIDLISYYIDYYDNIKVVIKTKDESIKDNTDKVKQSAEKCLTFFGDTKIEIVLNDEQINEITIK